MTDFLVGDEGLAALVQQLHAALVREGHHGEQSSANDAFFSHHEGAERPQVLNGAHCGASTVEVDVAPKPSFSFGGSVPLRPRKARQHSSPLEHATHSPHSLGSGLSPARQSLNGISGERGGGGASTIYSEAQPMSDSDRPSRLRRFSSYRSLMPHQSSSTESAQPSNEDGLQPSHRRGNSRPPLVLPTIQRRLEHQQQLADSCSNAPWIQAGASLSGDMRARSETPIDQYGAASVTEGNAGSSYSLRGFCAQAEAAPHCRRFRSAAGSSSASTPPRRLPRVASSIGRDRDGRSGDVSNSAISDAAAPTAGLAPRLGLLSNRGRIKLALESVCLAGAQRRAELVTALAALEQNPAVNQFLLLLASPDSHAYRGLYGLVTVGAQDAGGASHQQRYDAPGVRLLKLHDSGPPDLIHLLHAGAAVNTLYPTQYGLGTGGGGRITGVFKFATAQRCFAALPSTSDESPRPRRP